MGIARGWEKQVIQKNITYAKRTVHIFSEKTGEISHFIKALRIRQLRVKLISGVVKESSDSLFPG